MCRKFHFICVIIAIVSFFLPLNSFALSWVNVTDAYIEPLDENIYRFRAAFEWGGDIWTDPGTGYEVDPVLDYLLISNPFGEVLDWTYNHTGAMGWSRAGSWFGGVYPAASGEGASGLTGPWFGWDFYHEGPQPLFVQLSYSATLTWAEYDYASGIGYYGGSETHDGVFTVSARSPELLQSPVPEPSTLILLATGMIGLYPLRKYYSK